MVHVHGKVLKHYRSYLLQCIIQLIISGFTYCILAHSPDNSFMGFVVEQHLNDSDVKGIKRENWALVYGKNDYMYEVS